MEGIWFFEIWRSLALAKNPLVMNYYKPGGKPVYKIFFALRFSFKTSRNSSVYK